MAAPLIQVLWRRAIPPLWVAFAGFLFFIVSYSEHDAFAFPILLPITLFIFFAHEGTREGTGWTAGGIAWLLSLGAFIYLAGSLGWVERGVIFFQILMALLGMAALSRYFKKVAKNVADCQQKIGEIAASLKNILEENQFYSSRSRDLSAQIGSRQKFAAFARRMGTLLEPDSIQKMLLDESRTLFRQDEVSLRSSGYSLDPVDAWVNERKFSILIKEFARDPRFTASPNFSSYKGRIQSVIASPLVIEKKMLGMIRVDSKTGNRFNEGDLEQLEVYAHLAALALENAHLFHRVNDMATRDGLTNLATHRIFQEKLAEELLRAARYHKDMSLVMVDIDHFKSVNDTYGHLAGDEVLKGIANILVQFCREVDFSARYGGEEFVLIFPETELAEAARRAEEIRRTVENQSIETSTGPIKITACFGCAAFPKDAQSGAQLVRTADQRLYAAKSQGRNRVVSE